MKKKGKPPKIQCEICGLKEKKVLHLHHLIERTELNTDNSWYNLAVLCPTCHSKIHAGLIKVIGIYPSTKLPYKRTLIYESIDSKNMSGITEPYYVPKPKSIEWNYAKKDEEKDPSTK